ncbi:hypothetical protein ACLKA6_005334 [Drosophila palustris]
MSDLPQCVSSDSLFELRHAEQHAEKQKSIKWSDVVPKKSSIRVFKDKPNFKTQEEEIYYELWLSHRHRLRHIRHEVENQAPGYQWGRRTGACSLTKNAAQFMERSRQNIQLLVEISKTLRTHGVVNPFRTEKVYTSSSMPYTLRKLEDIDEANLDIARRLLDVVSDLDTGLKNKSKAKSTHVNTTPVKKRIHRSSKLLKVSPDRLAKYEGYNIQMPATKREHHLLLRPHIYFDIYLKDARPLGHIVVELYTEAAPVVVLELIRTCSHNMHKKFIIKRLFPDLWMDVEMPLHQITDLHKPLEYDAKVVDHGASGCLLSFRKDYLQGFHNNLCFSMSFRPIEVANGSRVGFGRIVEGGKIFDCLQSYGSKNGKLIRSILFTGCGVI